jgi:predicted transcriptional regulator of viral defense system
MTSKLDALRSEVRSAPFRTGDLAPLGIKRSYLERWLTQGVIERVARGLYRFADADITELATITEVARRAPGAVICLLSALQVHELGVENPSAVWLMIERHARIPKIDFVDTEIVRASGAALSHGQEARLVEGMEVTITTPAKTVADCFRFRKHIGLEPALDALRDYLRDDRRRQGPRYSVDALSEAMQACRVARFMRPYVEALI